MRFLFSLFLCCLFTAPAGATIASSQRHYTTRPHPTVGHPHSYPHVVVVQGRRCRKRVKYVRPYVIVRPAPRDPKQSAWTVNGVGAQTIINPFFESK